MLVCARVVCGDASQMYLLFATILSDDDECIYSVFPCICVLFDQYFSGFAKSQATDYSFCATTKKCRKADLKIVYAATKELKLGRNE